MPIDLKKCCGTHSKEKEDNGECCQQSGQENAEALTYENEAKSVSQLLQEGMKLQRRLEDE